MGQWEFCIAYTIETSQYNFISISAIFYCDFILKGILEHLSHRLVSCVVTMDTRLCSWDIYLIKHIVNGIRIPVLQGCHLVQFYV